MKKSIYSLAVCLVLSILVIVVLAQLSEKVVRSKGSFLRVFRQHSIAEKLDLDIQFNSYYLAGAARDTVYLGNYEAPLHVLTIACNSGDTTHHVMNIAGIHEQKFWSVRLKVDYPNFYMYDGAVPKIYKGDARNWTARTFEGVNEYFVDLEPIATNSFAVRSLAGSTGDAALGKISNTDPTFELKADILQKQVDGYFCTAGYLSYEKTNHRLIYLYRYRNEFIIMDSGLHIVQKGTTIDTNSIAKIEIANIKSAGSRVFQKPPLVVNDKCAIDGDYLFVNSALLANNEVEDAHEAAAVIDVYNLADLKYKFSFYLFDHRTGEKLRDFRVTKDKLVALYKTHLQIFDLSKNYFP